MTDCIESKIREGDVFNFRYKQEVIDSINHSFVDFVHHCFDGRLIAKKINEEIILFDTYWMSSDFRPDSYSRKFSIKEANEKGYLTFLFNLDDVELVDSSVKYYYDESDWFNFSYQHGCYPRYALKKGAKRSKEQMLKTVNSSIDKIQQEIEWLKSKLEMVNRDKELVENGDLSFLLMIYN